MPGSCSEMSTAARSRTARAGAATARCPEDLPPALDADWQFVHGHHDLFGDGSLVILSMPGHTPGNQSLLVRLPGRTVLLTGDTAHLHSALDHPAPMSADTDPAAAVTSQHRLSALAEQTDAQIWVAHDPHDWPASAGPRRSPPRKRK